MSLVNLTPHAITLILADGREILLPPSGKIARVIPAAPASLEAITFEEDPINEGEDARPFTIDVASPPQTGRIEGLPSTREGGGDVFLVSGMVLAHPDLEGRRDVFGPGTGPADNPRRNAAGQIDGVRRLVRPAGF